MVYARLKFFLNDQPRTALLTDRGWTILHADAGMNALLNHICDFRYDPKGTPAGNGHTAELCADLAAELLGGTIER